MACGALRPGRTSAKPFPCARAAPTVGAWRTWIRNPSSPPLDVTVLDCPDALQLATFYAKLLGWRVEEGSDSDWAELLPPRGRVSVDEPGGEASLAFQRIDDFQRPTWPAGEHPQQFHLDFSVTDIDAAEPRALALGAVIHEHQPSGSGGFRVYLDPAGHPFCLCRSA
ncbi:VOC family protein [Brachybacterium sp. Z12]|nr:VOC family protein [Brachybacterium sp. Z12]